MNLLLDTHILIWALNDDPQLPERAREMILDPGNAVYYSVVSIWKVSIKHAFPMPCPGDQKWFPGVFILRKNAG